MVEVNGEWNMENGKWETTEQEQEKDRKKKKITE